MKKILVPIKSKLIPPPVNEELKNFKEVHKSPYSNTYYDSPDITWEYKPENSLRISDHWNFTSHGEKHCILEETEEYIENSWILAKFENNKYHIIKEFGKGVDGYMYTSLCKNQIQVLKHLYDNGGIEKTYDYYRKHRIKPPFVKEGYINNPTKLSQFISIDKVNAFKKSKPKAKKIIFIEDKHLSTLENVFNIYKQSKTLDKMLVNKDKIKKYNMYNFVAPKEESFEEIYTLVLDNGMAIDYKF